VYPGLYSRRGVGRRVCHPGSTSCYTTRVVPPATASCSCYSVLLLLQRPAPGSSCCSWSLLLFLVPPAVSPLSGVLPLFLFFPVFYRCFTAVLPQFLLKFPLFYLSFCLNSRCFCLKHRCFTACSCKSGKKSLNVVKVIKSWKSH